MYLSQRLSWQNGRLAYNFSALFVLPLFGIKLEPIEYENNPYKFPVS